MKILIMLLFLFVVAVGSYYVVCHLIRLFTGCDFDEAATKLHNFFNGTAMYSIENDNCFWTDIAENIKNVIGIKRYNKLIQLSQASISTPLIYFSKIGGMSCLNVSLFYNDDSTKIQLETTLCNVLRKYLYNHGYSQKTIVSWKVRNDLDMPYLQIKFATNKSEFKALEAEICCNAQKIIAQNTDVTDDIDGDDLDE